MRICLSFSADNFFLQFFLTSWYSSLPTSSSSGTPENSWLTSSNLSQDLGERPRLLTVSSCRERLGVAPSSGS